MASGRSSFLRPLALASGRSANIDPADSRAAPGAPVHNYSQPTTGGLSASLVGISRFVCAVGRRLQLSAGVAQKSLRRRLRENGCYERAKQFTVLGAPLALG